jgi:16S rRNA (adenine1518-N6/adenine1519-N6)-dimethyltransferase
MRSDFNFLKSLLNKHKIKINKSLGQNFLLDEKILDLIIKNSEIDKNSEILEIGPGPGALTEKILEKKFNQLTVLEYDKQMIPLLKEFNDTRLNILNINALNYQILSEKIMLANLPYYLTSPLIRHFLEQEKLNLMILLVQKEVAEKICSNKSSILSMQVKLYGDPEIISLVSKDKFFPQPKVSSALLKIKLRKCLISKDYNDIFWQITKHIFKNKRKKILNACGNLKIFSELLRDIIVKNQIDINKRPEDISLKEYIKLSKYCFNLKNKVKNDKMK